ncbi:hypothetical protein [Planococcus soli]|uniref:hypothetical protein n=1 Tax=Planococcus soli TaxID=2666072 RepID=UPI00115D470C|nr:hypothetical protein [Planococcus soli]
MHTTDVKNHRPVTPKRSQKWQQERELALQQLRKAGFEIKEGKKTPKDGVYSGIVGKLGKVLVVNIKK